MLSPNGEPYQEKCWNLFQNKDQHSNKLPPNGGPDQVRCWNLFLALKPKDVSSSPQYHQMVSFALSQVTVNTRSPYHSYFNFTCGRFMWTMCTISTECICALFTCSFLKSDSSHAERRTQLHATHVCSIWSKRRISIAGFCCLTYIWNPWFQPC